ncbi:MAG: UDP-4-amino-4,6-dideoxy-N-acetyl-beta-L-altrosamine N-acetyltransferase [Chlorobium phaeovibrioides]|nr:UDP-4-amino-4,6-dideoxy-N-acetyl-beta-L-altrosamine N-acetyltransferase [Chlorobium phaeovibrioides]
MLKPINSENYKKIREWRNLPEVRCMMFTKHIISKEEHDAWWERVSGDPTQRWFMFAHNGTDLGVVCFIDIDNAIKTASWGFYLADDELFSSHQVSKRRVWLDLEKEAIDFAQHVLGLRALFCEVLEENKAVIKLHERSGFEEITHTHRAYAV